MNPMLLLSAIRARSRVFLFVLGATVLVSLVVSLLLPKTYVATVAMLVDSKDDQSMSLSPDAHVRERIGYMQTQVDIITSQKVARKVVDRLALADTSRVRRAFLRETNGEGVIEDWLSGEVLKQLKVETSQSSVIHISYATDDAQAAADIANAFARAYMDTALELRVEPSRQTAAWFDEQMKGLRARFEQAQARLTDYQKAKGVVDERFDVENIALTNLANQLARLQARRNGTAPTEALPNPGLQALRNEVHQAETRLQDLAGRLGSNHPWYQRQLSDTQQLRQRLASESARQPAVGGAPSPQREAELRDALQAQQARVLDMKQHRYQVAILLRDVEIAQKAYETAMQHAVDKQVESRASLTNVSLLHAAATPFKPARPHLLLNLGLALLLGSLLGLASIYLLEMSDHRVRSSDDLKQLLQVPVLAELSPWQPVPAQLPGLGPRTPALPTPG